MASTGPYLNSHRQPTFNSPLEAALPVGYRWVTFVFLPVTSGISIVSSIVPIFRSSGFDAEATRNLGKAYDIACLSLHPKGRPPVLQEDLAKEIVAAAQRGER